MLDPRRFGYTHAVLFTKLHLTGALKGLASPNQTIPYPTREQAERAAGVIREHRDVRDVEVIEL